jgi:hypothetical protein
MPSAYRASVPVLLIVAALIAGLTLASAPAVAQERGFLPGVFKSLFGQRQNERPAVEPAPKVVRPAPRKRSEGPTRPPSPDPITKAENARVILVVGDFLAAGLAEALTEVYAQAPGVKVVDRSNGSSGLVRDDFYDWNAQIGPILAEEQPAIVVVMIGANDRQSLGRGSGLNEVRSPAWTSEYERRTAAMANAVRQGGAALIWVGMPPFGSSSMSSDMLAFNDIYRRTAEKADGIFVDIWDGFVDEKGNFVTSGPDINGQIVRLRGSNGITLTSAGKRKVAFYAEKPLARLLGDALSPDIGRLGPDNLPPLTLPSGPAEQPDRTPPLSLDDPGLDGASELLGVVPLQPEAVLLTTRSRPASDEIDDKAPPGRADHFKWRSRQTGEAEGRRRTDPAPTTAIAQ